MSRIDDTKNRLDGALHEPVDDGYGAYQPCPCEWCVAASDRAYLLDLVERAVVFMEWFVEQKNPLAQQWLHDMEGDEDR